MCFMHILHSSSDYAKGREATDLQGLHDKVSEFQKQNTLLIKSEKQALDKCTRLEAAIKNLHSEVERLQKAVDTKEEECKELDYKHKQLHVQCESSPQTAKNQHQEDLNKTSSMYVNFLFCSEFYKFPLQDM